MTNRDKLLTGDPARLAPHKDGLVERIVMTEIEHAMGEAFEQMNEIRDQVEKLRSEQVERLD